MLLIQIIIILFSIFALIKLFQKFRQKEIFFRVFILWFIFWISVIIFVLNPEITNYFAFIFGVGRGADLILYLSLIVIFYLLFRISGKIYKIERDISSIVQEIAFLKYKTKRKNSGNKK